MRFCHHRFILLLAFLLTYIHGFGQESNDGASISQLISEEKYSEAERLLESEKQRFLNAGQLDSLTMFPEYIGTIEAANSNATGAISKAQDFIDLLAENRASNRILYKSYISLNDLYISLGDDEGSVVASKKALEYAKQTSDITGRELGEMNYIIGGNYYALYELDNAIDYFRDSASAYESDPESGKDKLSDAYNGVAVSHWTLNRLDSANFYFDKAITAAEQSDLESYRRIYYINAFKFNQALVIDGQGKIGEAIAVKQDVIKDLQKIIDESPNDSLVDRAKGLHASAISNLAAFYHDTGYLTRAYEMLKYALEKKREVLDPDSPRLANNLSQLALSEYEFREFDKSIESATEALNLLRSLPSDYLSLEADAVHAQARAYAAKGNIEKATVLYAESEAIYQRAYPNEYSREYLIVLKDYATFLAENGDADKAVSIATKAYEHVKERGGEDNFQLLSYILTLADVHYLAGDYSEALSWSRDANEYLDGKLQTAASRIDSVQIEFNRPAVILREVESQYKLAAEKDIELFSQLLARIHDAVIILEQRKTTTFELADINLLLEQYKGLNTMAKQLSLDLYTLTRDPQYLEQTLTLQESGVYNRIRTKFNIKNNVAFADIPTTVFQRETGLKQQLSQALNSGDETNITGFFNAETEWQSFLDSLRTEFPRYYEMRYASILEPLDDLRENLPENTTALRYLFIEDQLYVFLITKAETSLVPLTADNLEEDILALSENDFDLESIAPRLHRLYNALWFPFDDRITSERIIIVPDGILFNLSFETLTKNTISSLDELATESLLAKYEISYNFSLLLMRDTPTVIDYSNNFVAFAPQFTDEMKSDYRISISDSAALDKTYLTLIPQPFSAEIAKEYSEKFKGDAFLNEKSTKQIFTENAREHKIIHIGTHAESNNIAPELSRLIFAKNASGESDTDDNYLYTFEIYNQNLSSNLAILTACETGKPTYQAGEGMISLAHAFNYAGSESILTSLWKIDEQSSAQIIESFYEYLSQGLSKDASLRKAKLDYLASAQGRTAAPQYWAGLVLIGDTQPIQLTSSANYWYWIIGAGVLLLLFVFLRRRKSA